MKDPELPVRELQRLLRLEDWDITIKWASEDELPGAWGSIDWQDESGKATVSLRRDPDSRRLLETLLHELLHLAFAHLDCSAHQDSRTERAINRVAEALAEGLVKQGISLHETPDS